MTMQSYAQSYDSNLMKTVISGLVYMMNGKTYKELLLDQLEYDGKNSEELRKRIGKLKNLFEEDGIKGLSHAIFAVLDQLFEGQAEGMRAISKGTAMKSEEVEQHIESLRRSWIGAICGTCGDMGQGVQIRREVSDNEFKRGF